MEDALGNFRKRQKQVQRKHARMARGYVTKLGKNGVITQRPEKKGGSVLLRLLVLSALVFTGFKAILLAGLGPNEYLDTVAQLQLGTIFERAGAWLMQVDPVTAGLSTLLMPLFS